MEPEEDTPAVARCLDFSPEAPEEVRDSPMPPAAPEEDAGRPPADDLSPLPPAPSPVPELPPVESPGSLPCWSPDSMGIRSPPPLSPQLAEVVAALPPAEDSLGSSPLLRSPQLELLPPAVDEGQEPCSPPAAWPQPASPDLAVPTAPAAASSSEDTPAIARRLNFSPEAEQEVSSGSSGPKPPDPGAEAEAPQETSLKSMLDSIRSRKRAGSSRRSARCSRSPVPATCRNQSPAPATPCQQPQSTPARGSKRARARAQTAQNSPESPPAVTPPPGAKQDLQGQRPRPSVEVPPPPAIRKMLWKTQVPFLYDIMALQRRDPPVTALAWPAGQQCLVAGTSSSLQLLAVKLPPGDDEAAAEGPEPEEAAQVRVKSALRHEGPVRHVALSPHRPLLLATQAERGEVLLFDAGRWPAGDRGACKPDFRLANREATPGPGVLAWDPFHEGHLASGHAAGRLRLWDAMAADKCIGSAAAHAGGLGEVAYSPSRINALGTCGSTDGRVSLWDSRTLRAGASTVVKAHTGGTSCLAFGTGGTDLLATAGADAMLRIWDMRQLNAALHALVWKDGGKRPVQSVRIAWAPFDGAVIAAASKAGPVLLWDLCEVGGPQPSPHVQEPPPECVFMHGGHTEGAASSLAWCPDVPWLLASGAAGSFPGTGELHLWRPAAAVRPA